MAAKKSTRKAPAAHAGVREVLATVNRSTSRRRASAPAACGVSPTELDALLERLSNALSIVATATRSLSYSQADLRPIPGHDVGEEFVTLEHGVTALRTVYNELDVAIREVRA